MSGNGSWRLRNSEHGVKWEEQVKAIRQFSSAMGILESARHLSGNMEYYPRKESESVLTMGTDSSLVVDRLCDQTRGQNTAVTCFYFDFGARKDRVPNGPTGQVSEAGPDWPVLVDVDDWT